MMHDDLLDLADHLARRESGRPKQVSLRRAIATAYYGLFHRLALLCAETLVGWSNPWEAFTPIYRSMDHGHAKRLFERHRDGTLFGEEVAKIGQIFISLQAARHRADYDPQPLSLSRGETLELLDQARQAVEAIRGIPADKAKLLAVHLIARSR